MNNNFSDPNKTYDDIIFQQNLDAVEGLLDYYEYKGKLDPVHDHFKALQVQSYEIFKVKDAMYGRSNISGEPNADIDNPEIYKKALLGLYFRMRDKLNRFYNIVDNDLTDTSDETTLDTMIDLANYAYITALIYQKNGNKARLH